MKSFTALLILYLSIDSIRGHGMLLDPPNRSSLWRYNPAAPANYDDNQNYCGGATVQWSTFEGKCGVCGDRYDVPHPQPNENTGKWGQGIIAKQYSSGSVIDIYVRLTTNHKGFFTFSLCKLENANTYESGESCFEAISLANGQSQYDVDPSENDVYLSLKLPSGIKCDRCVLRWHYQAGNNWGQCSDGSFAQGCGPQETFRSCADIAIL